MQVSGAINGLIQSICTEAKVDTKSIYELVFVCNPVMHHLLLGIDPVELGQAPFALATSSSLSLDARDLDLAAVNHTNFCDIGVKFDPSTGRGVVVSAIDNLGKGASGAAVQNLNLMLGLTETAGLA